MKNIKTKQDIMNLYEKLFEYRGCFKFYESNSMDQGYQILMADGNSGAIFSIEVVPETNKVEIRSNVYQRDGDFATKAILEKLQSNYPLFSDFLIDSLEELPLISLEEEKKLPFVMPLQDRILMYSPQYKNINIYFNDNKQFPDLLKFRLRQLEKQFIVDMAIANNISKEIIDSKLANLPQKFIDRYSSYSDLTVIYENGTEKKFYLA